MKERKYNIEMTVPIGIRYGTLSFTEENGILCGMLELFRHSEPFEGTLGEDDTIEFVGKMVTLRHTFCYKAKGKIINTKIELEVWGERNHFFISGEEVQI